MSAHPPRDLHTLQCQGQATSSAHQALPHKHVCVICRNSGGGITFTTAEHLKTHTDAEHEKQLDRTEHCGVGGCQSDLATKNELQAHQHEERPSTPQSQLMQFRLMLEQAKSEEAERQEKRIARERQSQRAHNEREKTALQRERQQNDALLSFTTAMSQQLPDLERWRKEIDEELAKSEQDE